MPVQCTRVLPGHSVYEVWGIIQSRVNGEWYETTVLQEVQAERFRGGQQAIAAVLEQYARDDQARDPHATTRWYNPPSARERQEEAR